MSETNASVIPQTDTGHTKADYIAWWWALVIFGLVIWAYIMMDIAGINANKDTRFWAITISAIGAAIATAYHYR